MKLASVAFLPPSISIPGVGLRSGIRTDVRGVVDISLIAEYGLIKITTKEGVVVVPLARVEHAVPAASPASQAAQVKSSK